MRYLKTFESYSVNEEVFGFSKSERLEKKKNELGKELDKYLIVWQKKGAITKPTESEMEKFWSDAKADGYNGSIGIEDKKISYRKEKDVKWSTPGGHTFGSGS